MNQFGLTDKEYQLLYSLVIEPLLREGAKVWIFGSRARAQHVPFSDVDIMVEAKHDLTGLIGQVRESIVESNFPYKVDIVELQNFATEYRAMFEREKVSVK